LPNLFYSKDKITFLVIAIKENRDAFKNNNLLLLKIASICLIFSKVRIITFTALNLQNSEFLSEVDVVYSSSDNLREGSTVSAYEVVTSASFFLKRVELYFWL
jgi:hypothetical protein